MSCSTIWIFACFSVQPDELDLIGENRIYTADMDSLSYGSIKCVGNL